MNLRHDKPVYYRTDAMGLKLIKRRMKAKKMNLSEYMRWAVQAEQSWENYINALKALGSKK